MVVFLIDSKLLYYFVCLYNFKGFISCFLLLMVMDHSILHGRLFSHRFIIDFEDSFQIMVAIRYTIDLARIMEPLR